jgi:ABC-type glutathione transport system ATPase component
MGKRKGGELEDSPKKKLNKLNDKKRKNDSDSNDRKSKAQKTSVKTIPAKVDVKKEDLLQVGDTIYIKKFPMETLHTKYEGKRVLIVGKLSLIFLILTFLGMSGSGKSTVALDIIRYNKDIPAW